MLVPALPGYLHAELDSLRQGAFRLAAEVDEIVAETQEAGKQIVLVLAEWLRGPIVRRRILTNYDGYIKAAAKDAFQANMMRAIVYEEKAHEFPPILEGAFEELGFGDSVGPSQIRVSLWAEKYRTNRRDLLDARTHFKMMRQHLDEVERRAAAKGMSRNPENIGSLWNNMSARAPSNYGKRVQVFFDRFAEETTRAQALADEKARQDAVAREREAKEVEAAEAQRRIQREQREGQFNYGAPARSWLPSDEVRNDSAPTSSIDRFADMMREIEKRRRKEEEEKKKREEEKKKKEEEEKKRKEEEEKKKKEEEERRRNGEDWSSSPSNPGSSPEPEKVPPLSKDEKKRTNIGPIRYD
jgi:hypothetical protein